MLQCRSVLLWWITSVSFLRMSNNLLHVLLRFLASQHHHLRKHLSCLTSRKNYLFLKQHIEGHHSDNESRRQEEGTKSASYSNSCPLSTSMRLWTFFQISYESHRGGSNFESDKCQRRKNENRVMWILVTAPVWHTIETNQPHVTYLQFGLHIAAASRENWQ